MQQKGGIVISYIDKKELYNIVDRRRRKFEITDDDYPLNIFEFCSYINNVQIIQAPFVTHGLRGMVKIAKQKGENHIIIVNSNLSFEEQNFQGFHELMHAATADKAGTFLNYYERVRPNQDSYLEWLANEGAAEFTVPYKMLLPLVKENYPYMTKNWGTSRFCNLYADNFSVSPIVMQNRIDSLKYEISQYVNGVPLDKIEILSNNKQKQRGIHVKSLVEIEKERFAAMWVKRSNVV